MTCTNCDDGICTNNCQPHGVAATKGHLSSNGGLRAHSVDDVFPWIVMQRGNRIGVLTPSGWFRAARTNTWDAAGKLGYEMKDQDIKQPDDETCQSATFIVSVWEYIGSK
ncbi:coil containing protein [Vibrio phage 1.070.O._10N.261.45.B2]|nr:coil containing protein [Vibrio phage 1.070.O._10N.261.45.B2]